MKANRILLGLFVLIFGLSSQAAFAQRYEIHPYAGGFFPGDWRDEWKLRKEGVYGFKGGVFASDRVLLEGHWGWMPHFEFKGTDPRARAMIWEFTPSINFFSSNFGKVVPYVTAGVGGVTGYIGDIPTSDDRDVDISGVSIAFRGENDFEVKAADMLRNATPNDPGTPPQSLIMEDGDSFFAISYGGGIKAINVWGPLGFRGDVRGRSMPNFFGNSMTWLELTGGLTFNWGER